MDKKIILKPTDYVHYKDGSVDYSYGLQSQYADGSQLDELSKTDLLAECKKRREEFLRFPIPSNFSRYSLANDMAKAKGFSQTESFMKIKTDETKTTTNVQREF